MGNIYQVVEKATIKCACGGEVILKSTSPNMIINDSKPLYWKDLLGAPIKNCPNTSPCTKVVSITNLGTEKNVGDSKDTFLLRTDGFKSDRSRDIILINPGQHTYSIPDIPTTESSVVDYEKDIIEILEKNNSTNKAKYRLYFLRKSKNILKVLRPTRAFRNSKEINQIEDETLKTFKVYTHTFAYLYISQDEIIKEYKVAYKGQAYNEKILDIYFVDENGYILNFIPIEKDSEVKISYSNFKLDMVKDTSTISKLHKITIKPSKLEIKDTKSFYTNKDNLNFEDLDTTKEDFKTIYLFYKPDLKDNKNINIFCVIDDILGEIEDRYFELEDSFKNAYKQNNSYIAKVQEINNYPVMITSLLEYFYTNKKEEEFLEELETIYHKLVTIYLSHPKIIFNIFDKNNSIIDWIFEKDSFDMGLSYITKFKQVKYNFFEEFEINPLTHGLGFYTNKDGFSTISLQKPYIYYKNFSSTNIKLNNSDSKFTLIKNNANEVLASVIFTTLFSQKFDDLLNDEILNLGKNIDEILIQLRPIPYLDEKKKEDLKKEINKNEIYKDTLSLSETKTKDDYLNSYSSLDLVCRKNSFQQDGKIVEKLFNTNYLYFPSKKESEKSSDSLLSKLLKLSNSDKIKFYEKDSKDEEFRLPKDILGEIDVLLRSDRLKNILNIYKELEYEKDEEKLTYILGLKNIVHLLCTSRLNIDEEQEINNLFNPKLKHILEFEKHIIKQNKTLAEDRVVQQITDYKITQAHSYLLQKAYIFAILKGGDFKINVESFKEEYKKETNEIKNEIDKQNEPKLHRFKEVEKIELMKENLEFIKNVEGITSQVEEALDKVLKDEQSKTKHQIITRYQASLNNFSKIVAVLKVAYFLIDNKEKKILDYANFANDTIVLFKVVDSVLNLSRNFKTEIDTIKAVLNKLVGKNIYSNITSSLKINIFMQTIKAVLEINDYNEKRDYKASTLTALSAGVAISLLIVIPNPTTLGAIIGGISSIIFGIAMGRIESSELTTFLRRTIFAKSGISKEFIAYGVYVEENKNYNQIVYNPYFLNQAFEIKDNKKYLEFKTPKELISFIGNNYKDNKELFDLAYKNELQFLHTTLIGMKLEIDEKKVQEGNLTKETFLKIPKTLIDDEKAEFLLNGEKYDPTNRKLFIDKIDYYHFDLYDYFNKTKNTIILNSSIVNLKYEFEYIYSFTSLTDIYIGEKATEYYGIKNFKQTSFK